ncbi:MAG TPA: hypothetical protein VME18_05300 [Acidobacteriaceae bacterium]|nr:hypothetical protein [Acidobacteriaceae bacterium]
MALLISVCARGQVFIVQSQHISQHYAHFQPTQVRLPADPMTTIGREELIRFLQSEEGFAMRPLPVAVLTLHANGGMEPTGDKYIDELQTKGIAATPGQRVQITAIRIHDNRIILDLNNGPYHRHRFMRHISISMDPYDDPVLLTDPAPSGTRIVLVFPSRVPDLTGEQAEQLLKPMIDFGVRSPAEAYAETLPDFLRRAILEHRVLVGMDRQMVLYAKGEPDQKDREQANGKPFVIWIYGQAPDPVEFVRFVGDFVVRVEVAKVGEPILVHSDNQMGDYWGKQPPATAPDVHMVELGDRTAQNAAQQNAPPVAPTLRNPGEKLPTDNSSTDVMRPVKFPPGMQEPGDPGYTPPASQPSASGQSQPASANGKQATPASGRQTPANGQQTGTTAKTSQTPTAAKTGQAGASTASTPGKQPPASNPPADTPQQFVSSSQTAAQPPR